MFFLLPLLFLLLASSVPVASANPLLEHYRNALAIDPDNPTLHYHLGVAYLVDNRNSEAAAEFTLAYPAYTDSLEMNYNFGVAVSRLGDPDSALLYFERAEQLGATAQSAVYPLADAYAGIAQLYLERGELDESLRLFGHVLELDPSRIEVYRLRGDIFNRKGETLRATEEFRRYLTFDPHDPLARQFLFAILYNLGLDAFDQGRLAEASQAFGEAQQYDPNNPLPPYYLGVIAYQQGRYGDAASAFAAAYGGAPVEIRTGMRTMLYNCALNLLRQGSLESAGQAMEPLIAAADANSRELFLAGNIRMAQNAFASAADYFTRALASEPGHQGAALNLAAAQNALVDQLFGEAQKLFQAGSYAQALPLFLQVEERNPAYPLLRQYLQETRTELARQAEDHYLRAEQALAAGEPQQALDAVRAGNALAPWLSRGSQLEAQIRQELQTAIRTALDDANGALSREDWAAARREYQTVLHLDPAQAEALAGIEALGAKERDLARAEVARGAQAIASGELLTARNAYAAALALMPSLPEAQAGMQEVTRRCDQQADMETRAGHQARAAGRLDQAIAHLQQARLYAERPELADEIAQLLAEQQALLGSRQQAIRSALANLEIKKARTLLEQARALAPADASLTPLETELAAATADAVRQFLARAAASSADRNYQAALVDYRRVLDLQPANTQALQGLEQGRKQLQQDLTRLVAEGNQQLVAGDSAKAETLFAAALDIDPFHAPAKAGLERIARSRASGAKPGDEDLLYLRGIDLYTRGEYEEAIAVWEKVLLLKPQHDKAKANIDKARRKIRQIKEFRHG